MNRHRAGWQRDEVCRIKHVYDKNDVSVYRDAAVVAEVEGFG